MTWHNPHPQQQDAHLAPAARTLQSTVALAGRLLILGGMTTPGRRALSDVRLAARRPAGRTRSRSARRRRPLGALSVVHGRSVVLFGGCDERRC